MKTLLTDFLTLAERATPGPWATDYPGEKGCMIDNNGAQIAITTDREFFSSSFSSKQDQANAEFIAASRTLAPKLAKALMLAQQDLNSIKNIGSVREDKTCKQLANLAEACLTEIENILALAAEKKE